MLPIKLRNRLTDEHIRATMAQAKRMFALAKGDAELVRVVLKEHGYTR